MVSDTIRREPASFCRHYGDGSRRLVVGAERMRDMTATRADGRAPDELRPITFERDFTAMAAGSCLVSFGSTRVLCTASVDEDVPRWMKGRGRGWVTAGYSMLPGARSEEHTSELQSLMRISYAVLCLNK